MRHEKIRKTEAKPHLMPLPRMSNKKKKNGAENLTHAATAHK